VSYERLLELFFEMHVPSHWSAGSQYRSAIFTFDDPQRETAEAVRDRIRGQGEVVRTEITPASTFWPAEDYHQQYYEKRGMGSPAGAGCLVG
jgi:peptide methionine sulfoxide reductase MsrA